MFLRQHLCLVKLLIFVQRGLLRVTLLVLTPKVATFVEVLRIQLFVPI